jgi:hypothetical protein
VNYFRYFCFKDFLKRKAVVFCNNVQSIKILACKFICSNSISSCSSSAFYNLFREERWVCVFCSNKYSWVCNTLFVPMF